MIERAPPSSSSRWSMGLLARWLSFPLLGPPRTETWPRTEASKGSEKTPSERARLDEIGA